MGQCGILLALLPNSDEAAALPEPEPNRFLAYAVLTDVRLLLNVKEVHRLGLNRVMCVDGKLLLSMTAIGRWSEVRF